MLEWISKFLNGKKTMIGIIAGIATFALVGANSLSDGFQFSDVKTLLGGFALLMIVIGLGNKAEKILDLMKK